MSGSYDKSRFERICQESDTGGITKFLCEQFVKDNLSELSCG